MLACTTDYYNIGAEPKVPDTGLEKVKDYLQINIEPVMESALYTGLTNQLAESVMRLRDEYRNVNENLEYPSVLFGLNQFIAKDYVRCHTTMADLQLMKMMHFAQRLLLGYANSNFSVKKAGDPKLLKDKYCNGMVYIDMSEKLSSYRKKRITLIDAEVKRIAWNVDNIPSVKATGKLSLLIDAFSHVSPLLAYGCPIILIGLNYIW
ncbi:uncharacterized protein BXIN_2875 [Babesia sp. Xinjiang]|uniref:uncharacterized protein n=1 Tax=Babesia sp. Xinjiang TaxID=462227 RepID=UPI000A2422C4|nr:uncharacterized protein BXIN_2875 [Babesia sp. Xinjiang]ORM39507.1 hypothetical protein BXIN_2875 [Babesia sp. Xinjiang]